MDTIAYDLEGRRNVPFPPDVITLTDSGSAVNLSGMTFAIDVRAVPGEGSALISLDTAASDTADGIWVVNAAAGELRIQIDQASMQAAWDASYAAGLMKAGDPAPLFYDLLVFSSGGIPAAWLAGRFNILPGVTL